MAPEQMKHLACTGRRNNGLIAVIVVDYGYPRPAVDVAAAVFTIVGGTFRPLDDQQINRRDEGRVDKFFVFFSGIHIHSSVLSSFMLKLQLNG